MTAKEFLATIPEFPASVPVSEEEIEELTELWGTLIERLDFHHYAKKSFDWYERDKNGDWSPISFQRVHDVLYHLGIGEETKFEKVIEYIHGERVEKSVVVPDEDRMRIVKQFFDRDDDTYVRDKETIEAAQRRFGF